MQKKAKLFDNGDYLNFNGTRVKGIEPPKIFLLVTTIA